MKFLIALLAVALIYAGVTGKYRAVYTILTGGSLPEFQSPWSGGGARGGGGGGGGSSGAG